jgi:hypothetical protein
VLCRSFNFADGTAAARLAGAKPTRSSTLAVRRAPAAALAERVVEVVEGREVVQWRARGSRSFNFEDGTAAARLGGAKESLD